MTKVEADYEHVQKEGETDITINKYINTVKAMGESTALEYESRLKNITQNMFTKNITLAQTVLLMSLFRRKRNTRHKPL